MSILVWDAVGNRTFESGLDRGVLYLENNYGVAWNGLVSVIEKAAITVESLYYDGKKFNDSILLGDFAGTLSAFTYPDEFAEFEGVLEIGNGVYVLNQRIKRFGLSYRTLFGDDINGVDASYKIHILYNLLAVPAEISFLSFSETIEPIIFQWDITAVPVDTPNYEPTAHVILDTRKMPKYVVEEVEAYLYGTEENEPELPPMSFFVNLGKTGLLE